MTNLKECAESNFKVVYPYIKQICMNEHQEEWLLNFYYQEVLPYAQDVVEKEFIAKQNISTRSMQFFYIKQFFDFENKSVDDLSDEGLCLHNRLNEMNPLLRKFQDSYFSNIWNRKEGFSAQSFYSDQYIIGIRQLLELSILFWMLVTLESALQAEPNDASLKEYQKWANRRLVIHSNNTTTFYGQMILEAYKPSILWYFLNGTERFFIFFQMERIRFDQIVNNTKQSLHSFLNNNLDRRKVVVEFPVAAIYFSLNILFLILLPYRFLRTLTNEIFHYIKSPITGLIEKFNPRYKLDTASHLLYLSLLILIYGSLLTLFSLPLMPLPLTWMPNILLSPVAAIIPLSYLFFVPCIAIVKKIYRRFQSYEQPGEMVSTDHGADNALVDIGSDIGSDIESDIEPDRSLLHRYRNQPILKRFTAGVTSSVERGLEEEDMPLFSQRFI